MATGVLFESFSKSLASSDELKIGQKLSGKKNQKGEKFQD